MNTYRKFFILMFCCMLAVFITGEYHRHRYNNIIQQITEAEQINQVPAPEPEPEPEPAHAPLPTPVPVKVNNEHLRCLATGIYFEARGEPLLGQVAVARVVMNRVAHGFGSNPCKVVYQTTKVSDAKDSDIMKTLCQFSWVCEGLNNPPRNSAYIQAETIAKKVLLEDKYADLVPSNVLFFHNTSVKPGWNYSRTMIIGNHVFYAKGREKK